MRNDNRNSYPAGWARISYRVKRLHGFRCARCGHPHVPNRRRATGDLWDRDFLMLGDGDAAVIVPRNRLLARWRVAGFPGRPVGQGWTRCDRGCRHDADGKPRVLTVHHLDGDKANRRAWNLAALCQVCHLQVQGRVCWDQGWLWGHTEWMRWHVERYRRWCRRRGEPAFH